MPLSDTKLRALKTPGKYFDGGGLYLEITASGGRYWRQKYRFAGKEKRLAFGVYPTISLKEARQQRDAAKKLLNEQVDPGAVKQARKRQLKVNAGNSVEQVAKRWIDHCRSGWSTSHAERTLASLASDIFPAIGHRPIAEIVATDIKSLVKQIEDRGAGELASRVLMRVRAIFRYAAVNEIIPINPLTDLKPGDVLKPRQVESRAALPKAELPRFLQKLNEFDGDVATREGLRLLLLTAVRPGEVRGAKWAEFELDKALWRIPAERMKMRTEHLVPLSKQAISAIESLRSLTGNNDLLLPSPYNSHKPLSENTFNSALARMGYKGIATAHGFRALFSTAANEAGWNPDAIERQLAHQERNKIRAAYHRSVYLDDRRKIMQWWSDQIDCAMAAPTGRTD